MIIVGRNDDYEPGWVERLQACLRYNRALFEKSSVEFRAVFIEWNPPESRPLLSPMLVERFPFVRAVVIDRAVHRDLCLHPSLTVLLNFAINPSIRSSRADFVFISGGDIFLGRHLAQRIIDKGLKSNCLYRAERVSIRNTLDFPHCAADDIENPANVVAVDSCTEPGSDQPPFTNACGDFILMDRLSMMALRGFDESIRHARLHLDSRLCWTTQAAGMDCELLGRIYHIDHSRSFFRNTSSYPGAVYSPRDNLPYLNPRNWGLADYHWSAESERLLHVRPFSGGVAGERRSIPDVLTAGEHTVMNSITRRVLEKRRETHQLSPATDLPLSFWKQAIDLTTLQLHPSCDQGAMTGSNPVVLTTGPKAWEWTATLTVRPWHYWFPTRWSWLRLKLRVVSGQIHVGILTREGNICGEKPINPSEQPIEVFVPVTRGTDTTMMIRNSGPDGPARVELHRAQIVYQPRDNRLTEADVLESFEESRHIQGRLPLFKKAG